MERKISATMIGASPSEGSSSSRSFGLAMMARAMASICCWPPLRMLAGSRARSLRAGNFSIHGIDVGGNLLVGAHIGAHHQVFSDRHSGQDAAAFRRLGDAGADDLVGPIGVNLRAVKGDRALARLDDAGDGLQQGRLAGAIGADQSDDLAFLDGQSDAMQHFDFAVTGMDVLNRKHHARV